GGVEVKQLAQQDARARAGIGGKRQRTRLHLKGAVGIVRDQQRGLFSGRDFRGLGRRGILTREKSLMSALAQVPEDAGHDERRGEQDREQYLLVAGNHGWRGSMRHSRSAAARDAAMRAW